ncbi:hypothetical protein P3X46_023140 [Hevea brasiliensis]|uniref:PHD-type domain-containing protein n=1 Tax=Hevea brasiliensis TaxID=3981 RepID=A0ABQ9LB57_HEVBR|nr:PHD and RING finger domain-containing protein C126.07c isoform X2 [Hevea brasiliensis]KAJ9163477.1 hypothetical protein P3X46_023140 [Hevea brasiliensis]
MATDSLPNPNKRLKSLLSDSCCTIKEENHQYESEREQEGEENQSQRDQLVSVSMFGEDSLSCGICLSDHASAIRGQIDSCEHFFCFVCIMEWAKVESRCPMCKSRFTTIRRPPKDGVFSSERIVNIPKRDQVYHFSRNTTNGPFDPYAQVQCSICCLGRDENLLLLCDLCDSAAHTYCVGLGATVPEGDWFCHDCAVSRTEHDNIQKDDDNMNQDLYVKSLVMLAAESRVSMFNDVVDNQNTSGNTNVLAVDEADVSIFDIVRESDDQLFRRPRTRFSCERQHSLANELTRPGEITPQFGSVEGAPQSDADKVTHSGARTLSRCRNVQGYIRALRENWNSLRSGSLRFSSGPRESSIGKCNTLALSHDNSGIAQSLSSITAHELTTKDSLPGILVQDRHSHDIDKAWKMMDKAKSVQKACRRTKSVHSESKSHDNKGNSSRKAIDGSPSLHLPRSQQLGTPGLGNTGTEKQYKHCSPEKQTNMHIFTKLKMQKHSKVAMKEIVECTDTLPTICSPQFSVSASSSKVQTSSPRASESSNTKEDLSGLSSCKVDFPKGEVKMEKVCAESKAREDDGAKSEIQSLVKLNLKLLNRDKQLEINAFKEVARLATHTILAACGFGHSRHAVHSVPSCVCGHSERTQQLRKSTLMPNSCRECFYVFVKDVVSSILSEKVSHAKS